MSDIDDILRGMSPDDIRVLDGDTFETPDGVVHRTSRFDSPETEKSDPGSQGMLVQQQEAGADIATSVLDTILKEMNPELVATGDATHGRSVTDVNIDGDNISTKLIEAGVARPTLFSDQEDLNAENASMFRDVMNQKTGMDYMMDMDREFRPPSLNLGSANRSGTGSDTRGSFNKAVTRGTDNTQALLYAATNAFGEITGLESIEEWGDEGVRTNMQEAARSPADIESFDDVQSLADFWTYSVEAVGEQVPNIALTAAGAGGATLALRAAAGKALLARAGAGIPLGGVKAGVEASKLVQRAPLLGAAATTYPLGVGEVQQELKGAGIDSPGTAFIAGLPIAALDAVSFDIIFGKLFKGVKREMAEDLVSGTASALGFMKDVAKGGLVGGLTEMPTETMQELIAITAHAYHDPEYEIFSDENLHRLRETAIKAGIVGTAGGGFSSGVQNIREQPPLIAPEEPPIVTPPTEDVIPVDAIESIPVDHVTQIEGVDEPQNTREMIKTIYDEPIKALEQLAKCMGG